MLTLLSTRLGTNLREDSAVRQVMEKRFERDFTATAEGFLFGTPRTEPSVLITWEPTQQG